LFDADIYIFVCFTAHNLFHRIHQFFESLGFHPDHLLMPYPLGGLNEAVKQQSQMLLL
jgi:hypothetical protein